MVCAGRFTSAVSTESYIRLNELQKRIEQVLQKNEFNALVVSNLVMLKVLYVGCSHELQRREREVTTQALNSKRPRLRFVAMARLDLPIGTILLSMRYYRDRQRHWRRHCKDSRMQARC